MKWIACSDRVDWADLDIDVSAQSGWCRDPVVPDDVDEVGFIGCREDCDRAHLERRLRSAGFDPFGVPIVILSKSDRESTARIRARVASVRARTEHYPGAGPEHLKPVMPPVVSRRSFLSFRAPAYRVVPHPDASCGAGDGCRACVDVCSHGALDWSRGVIQQDRLACAGCGRCITNCPAGAMVNPAYTPTQIHAELMGLAASIAEPLGVVYRCARDPLPETVPGWFNLVVPCVGMLPPHWVLAPLLLGASAVAVGACGCGLEPDSDRRAVAAVGFARSWLDAADVAPDRRVVDSPTTELVEPLAFGAVENPYLPGGAAVVAAALGPVLVEGESSPLGVVAIDESACTGCEMCTTVCPSAALRAVPADGELVIEFDPSVCTACRQCIDRCPETGAISVRPVVDAAELAVGRRTLTVHRLVKCVRCGGSVAPEAALERIAESLGDDAKALKQITSVCLDCRGTTMVF